MKAGELFLGRFVMARNHDSGFRPACVVRIEAPDVNIDGVPWHGEYRGVVSAVVALVPYQEESGRDLATFFLLHAEFDPKTAGPDDAVFSDLRPLNVDLIPRRVPA